MTEQVTQREFFTRLVDHHAQGLFRFAARMLADQATAEDLVQETFEIAWRSLDSLRERERARAWLFQILRNRIARQWRRHERKTDSAVGLAGVESDDTKEIVDNSAAEPWQGLETRELVEQALEQLDEGQREVVLLVSMEGLTVDEAAEVTGHPRGTILSRLHRGKARIRDWLSTQSDDVISEYRR